MKLPHNIFHDTKIFEALYLYKRAR